MSITATCGACGRNFIAPDKFQGKRVKCKGCGEIFTVQSADASGHLVDSDAETDPLSQLAAVAVSDSNTGSHGSTSDQSDEEEEEHAGPTGAGLMPNVLTFDYPGSSDVDKWLPITLVVIGFLLLTASASNQDSSGPGWISVTRFLTPALLYATFTFPITLAMVCKAAKEQRYALPPNYVLRCFGSYMPAFVLITWMQMAGDGLTIVQLLAGIFGLCISSTLLWLLFRLREEHIGTTVAYGAGGFAAGIAFTIALTMGINKIGQLIVVSNHAQASIPVSPFGEGLSWPAVPPAPVVVAAAKPAPPPPPAAIETTAVALPGAAVIGQFDPQTIPGVFDDIINPFGSGPFVGVIRSKPKSVSIESWNIETWESKTGTLQLPGRPAGNIAISTDGERLAWIAEFPRLAIQIWSFSSGTVISSVDLDRSQGDADLIGFVSSDLLLIDRTASKPVPTVATPSPAENPVAEVPPPAVVSAPASDDFFQELNSKSRHHGGQPEAAPSAVAAPPAAPVAVAPVPTVKPAAIEPVEEQGAHHLSIVDVATGTTLRNFVLPPLAADPDTSPGIGSTGSLRDGQNIAVSVVSKRMASAVKVADIPSLLQIDLLTGRTLPTIKIPEIDPNLSGSPTGLAYSNDGTSLAALFENDGSALLLVYDTATGKKTSSFVYPSGPLDGVPHGSLRGSSICWLDPSPFWLVYGQGVVSTQTGAHLKSADLNLTNPSHQRFLEDDRVQLLTNTASGKRLNILKLDRTKLDTALELMSN